MLSLDTHFCILYDCRNNSVFFGAMNVVRDSNKFNMSKSPGSDVIIAQASYFCCFGVFYQIQLFVHDLLQTRQSSFIMKNECLPD
jgi:hypothetical protein